jgi:hypothetical protein
VAGRPVAFHESVGVVLVAVVVLSALAVPNSTTVADPRLAFLAGGGRRRDRRHPAAVPHGTAWPPPAAADWPETHRGEVGEMELDATATALPELIACPEPGCDVPAGVVDRFVLASTGGPVEHVRTWCLEGHGFTQRVDALVAWPMVRARRPLETG